MTCIEALQAAKDRPGLVGAMPIRGQKWVLVYTTKPGWCKRYAASDKRGGGLKSPVHGISIAPQLIFEQWTTVEIKP